MFADFMDKAHGLPDDEKKAINDWLAAYKKGRDDFKKATDGGARTGLGARGRPRGLGARGRPRG